MTLTLLLLGGSLLVILLAAELFTNSVEWLGHRLGLGEGAVGSILAAVGTAMPETIIPLIAILLVGGDAAQEIGVGAILGAPFMLSTAAFFVTGTAVFAFAAGGRRDTAMRVNSGILQRDIRYFILVYLFAIISTFLPSRPLKIGVAAILLFLYGRYVHRTLNDPTELSGHLMPLHLGRWHDHPPTVLIVLQSFLALGLMIGGARVFVNSVEAVAAAMAWSPLVLALLIAPLATELPEKFNSVLWVRQGKDTLAMGNITGAMVFQSCIPVSVGLLFTPWELARPGLVSALIALSSSGLVYYTIRRYGCLSPRALMMGGLFYAAYVSYVLLFL